MTKEEKHFVECSAPICKCGIRKNPGEKDTVVWYPGEPVCTMKPFSIYQQRQLTINKYIKSNPSKPFKKIDHPYTVEYLLKYSP